MTTRRKRRRKETKLAYALLMLTALHLGQAEFLGIEPKPRP